MGTYHGYFGKWAAFTKLTSESLPICGALTSLFLFVFVQWTVANAKRHA